MRMNGWMLLIVFFLAALSGCQLPSKVTPNPADSEVLLGSRAGFDAQLLYQGDVGIWTVACVPFFDGHGCSEVVALDDKGRCVVLSAYSGRWTPWIYANDGVWLGGLAHGDVDPRRDGRELYVGSQRGNIYQIVPHRQGGADSRVIAYLPGREVHTLVAADIDVTRPGSELLAFTNPGGLFRLSPVGDGGDFSMELVKELPGRVRDAVCINANAGNARAIATVSRAGDVSLLSFNKGKPVWREIYRAAMGCGRVALSPIRDKELVVLYVTCDDGRVVRLRELPDGRFSDETIYNGPQGPRGIVAGRFHDDPSTESVAVFGYSKDVVLLTRDGTSWRSETIFTDADRGHWLCTGELDGRNATDELVLCGYGKRVVLLTRKPAVK